MTETLAQGYICRPAGMDDAPAIHALIVASDMADWGEASGYSLGEVEDSLKQVDSATDTWLVMSPLGEAVGFASINDRSHLRMDVEGYVHPGHINQGIGTLLVRQSEARAREHVPLAAQGARVVVQNWINADNAQARELLEREGYSPFRYFLRMELALDGDLPTPEWPEGVSIRTCKAEPDQRLMYESMEEAMADHWGHVPRTFDAWMERKGGSTFDPTLWFLAVDDAKPIGGAVCSVSDGLGWVDNLGVLTSGRKRGIGMALLRHSACEFSRRGLKKMALGVDSESPTGATRLYERAGMHVAQKHATYGKELRPGVEMTG